MQKGRKGTAKMLRNNFEINVHMLPLLSYSLCFAIFVHTQNTIKLDDFAFSWSAHGNKSTEDYLKTMFMHERLSLAAR